MALPFRKLGLKWHEYVWALLPVGLTAIGGALGGLCGWTAAAFNLKLMRSDRGAIHKYALTTVISLVSVGLYLGLAMAFTLMFGAGSIASARVDRQLRNSPVFTAIQKADPATYEKIRGVMLDGVAHGKSAAELTSAVQPYIGMVTKRYLPTASDTAILDFTRVMTLEIDQIAAKSVDACAEFLHPHPGTPPVIIANFITPEVMRRDAEATQEIISSGSQNARMVPRKEEISSTLNQVMRQLVAKYGADDVGALGQSAALDHGKTCTITNEFFKEILVQPAADSAALLRFLYARHTAI